MTCIKHLSFCFLAILLISPAIIFTQEVNYQALAGLGNPQYHDLHYKPLDQRYHIFVRLPDNYDSTKSYPTVYLLDGGLTYPMLSAYYQTMIFSEVAPELIMVGISYGSFEHTEGNNRSRDFTAKSEERAYWGGADQFIFFFKEQLFPLIEEKYASDPNQRIIFGNSLGGQFVLYAAQKYPGVFWGHLASNPALHRNLDTFLSLTPSAEAANIKLYVGSGSDDEPVFRKPAVAWMNHWTAKEDTPWTLQAVTVEGKDHFTALPDIFYQGILWLFK